VAVGWPGAGSGGGREMRNRVDVPLPPVLEAEAEKGGGGRQVSRKGGRGRRGAVVVVKEEAVVLEFKTWLSRALRRW